MSFKAREIKKGVYWVGAVDWNLRNFHGYLTPRGSSYNAYLVVGEKKTALVDTVKAYFADELLERVASVVDPASLDYVVCNHVEMDHSGALPRVLEVAQKAKLVTCAAGEKGLREHFHRDWPFEVVKSGAALDLGGRTLSFVTTPMVHWPDNMVCHLKEERLLFSNDAFGQHYASPERFDDELPLHLVVEEAQKYFGNIVLCYQPMVAKALEQLAPLEVAMIAPSHGLIWRAHVRTILEHYRRWAANQTDERALIVYDTMWDSTAKMARAIAAGFENRGIPARLYDLKEAHVSEIMTEVVTARYLCVGSPTLNNTLMPTVAAFLAYLRGLSPKKRVALAFGSYGWGGQSIEHVHEQLGLCGFELLAPLKAKYVPEADVLHAITAKVEQMLAERSEKPDASAQRAG